MSDAEAPTDLVAEASQEVETSRLQEGRLEARPDRVAREEPLEIQVAGTPLAVTMRTPGHDLELVSGFLVTEGIVAGADQLSSVHHDSQSGEDENLVRVTLTGNTPFDAEKLRRNLFASSSCGVCGKASREAALATAPPLQDPARFAAAFFLALPESLRSAQLVFDETGGLHAAALFDGRGQLLVTREDVGRHNAVDKVVGWALRKERMPLSGHVLMVSGRISFEIVQKALAARIPAIAALSAPTSLAVELASDAGILLVGFLRGGAFNVYGAGQRLRPPDADADLAAGRGC